MASNINLESLLESMLTQAASDLYLTVGAPSISRYNPGYTVFEICIPCRAFC